MMVTRQSIVACGLALTTAILSGCVSFEERDRLVMANRALQGEKAQLEADLDDARGMADGLSAKTEGFETAIRDKTSLIENLQEENDSLDQQVAQARKIVEQTLAKIPVNDPVIVSGGLPAELNEALRAFATEHSDSVSYDEQRGVLKWSSDLLFVTGSDVVQAPAGESLRSFAEIVKSAAADPFEIMVVGHTDNRPIVRERTREKHPTNWHLSAHRAIAVGNVMLDAGYDAGRLSIVGCGEYRPLMPNANESDMSQNRRVDVYIVPRGALVAAGATRSSEPTK